MSRRPTVLVVEDEVAIREGLCDLLAYHGMQPTPAATGPEGLRQAQTGHYDLVILDVMLPGMDGIAVCTELRAARPSQAILVLTARGREEDVLEGFRAGCDDYVAKPFSIAQLTARVKALLRRAGAAANDFTIGDIVVRPERLVAEGAGRSVELTVRDVEVLARLHAEGDRVVSRAQLLTDVWGYQRVDAIETRCVDMHMVKLRRKLAEVGGEPVIETVRGAGYRLAP